MSRNAFTAPDFGVDPLEGVPQLDLSWVQPGVFATSEQLDDFLTEEFSKLPASKRGVFVKTPEHLSPLIEKPSVRQSNTATEIATTAGVAAIGAVTARSGAMCFDTKNIATRRSLLRRGMGAVAIASTALVFGALRKPNKASAATCYVPISCHKRCTGGVGTGCHDQQYHVYNTDVFGRCTIHNGYWFSCDYCITCCACG